MTNPIDLRTASPISIGDYVSCYISGSGGIVSYGFVLGWMFYPGIPDHNDIVLIGDANAHGMPVNASHLTILSRGHKVDAWQDRYRTLYPAAQLRLRP